MLTEKRLGAGEVLQVASDYSPVAGAAPGSVRPRRITGLPASDVGLVATDLVAGEAFGMAVLNNGDVYVHGRSRVLGCCEVLCRVLW
jgi:hypothetical protein